MNRSTPPEHQVHPVTRRRFLAFSGVAAAGALAVGATRINWTDLVAAAERTPLDPAAGVLVMVTLYGGNDGLNTVVPAADPAYSAARAELAYGADEVLDLGEGLGLNPGMTGLHKLWGDQQLAVLRGVGYPKPDRSHFRSMAIWQTASPTTAATTGWLGRWLDATTTDPLLARLVGHPDPTDAGGRDVRRRLPARRGPKIPKTALGRSLALLGRPDRADGLWQARAAQVDRRPAVRCRRHSNRPPRRTPTRTRRGATRTPRAPRPADRASCARQLDLVATLIELGVPTRVYSVSLGGFDTHSDERGTQQRLLTELDTALTRFQNRLAATDRGRQVVTAVYSEFGRRVTANASDGTDHGTAGPVFVLGRGVTGGFYGAEPSLTDLDDGDLRAGLGLPVACTPACSARCWVPNRAGCWTAGSSGWTGCSPDPTR